MKTIRVKSLHIKDLSLTKLADLGAEDVAYRRMISHIEKGNNLENIGDY